MAPKPRVGRFKAEILKVESDLDYHKEKMEFLRARLRYLKDQLDYARGKKKPPRGTPLRKSRLRRLVPRGEDPKAFFRKLLRDHTLREIAAMCSPPMHATGVHMALERLGVKSPRARPRGKLIGKAASRARAVQRERMRTIESLYSEGMTDIEIGDEIGLSPSTVRKVRCELGLVKYKLTPGRQLGPPARKKRDARMKRLYAKGMTDEEVAAEEGMSVLGVRKIRYSYGWDAPGQATKAPTTERLKQVKKLLAQELTVLEVARTLGISDGRVYGLRNILRRQKARKAGKKKKAKGKGKKRKS
ncbi:MAG: hypothetical protein IH851_03445 [Armatimonadetes bacterium]|nr:hypothetical protein [Armatimonadota bacterium]